MSAHCATDAARIPKLVELATCQTFVCRVPNATCQIGVISLLRSNPLKAAIKKITLRCSANTRRNEGSHYYFICRNLSRNSLGTAAGTASHAAHKTSPTLRQPPDGLAHAHKIAGVVIAGVSISTEVPRPDQPQGIDTSPRIAFEVGTPPRCWLP